MSFRTIAQELVVVDPSFTGNMSPSLSPLDAFQPELLTHQHDHNHDHVNGMGDDFGHTEELVISDPEHVDIIINVEQVPGAGNDIPEIVIEEPEEDDEEDSPKSKDNKKGEDDNDARKKSKKNEKWDWESKGADGFVLWIKERVEGVPRHSGMDTAGLERAISYLERLDAEISKAMRLDLDGDLDANKIEDVRSQIDDGLSRLEERLDKVKEKSKRKRSKKADAYSEGFIKEAQKITGVQGVFVTVPLLISRIARVCINGMVSAGHDIEDTYHKQVNLYKLSVREQAEVRQLIEDMGYAFRQDRGYTPEDALEVSDSNGIDWNSNYKG